MSVTANPDTIIKGNSSNLILTASPGANAIWLPNSSTSPPAGYNVSASPLVTTTYTVIISRLGCQETLRVTVYVLEDGCTEDDIFVPNTFTPNGDGFNDVMYVRGYKVSEIYFAIYNRWGEMVFETTDKTVGWDGNFKGRPADVGVFGYYVKVKCYNGLESFKKGNITLIR
jgi:gliding motility-associated-like protein